MGDLTTIERRCRPPGTLEQLASANRNKGLQRIPCATYSEYRIEALRHSARLLFAGILALSGRREPPFLSREDRGVHTSS